jgi:hypothetical protein
MDRVQFIRRQANAESTVTTALEQLAARFELPQGFKMKADVRVGHGATQRLLDMEQLANSLQQLVTAPVREDANVRLESIETPTALPITIEIMPEAAPPPQPVRVTSGFGFPENDGPPVLHAINRANIDAFGRSHLSMPEYAADHTAAQAAASLDYQEAINRAVQEETAEVPVQDGDRFGFPDNPGPPVMAPEGARHVSALGQPVLIPVQKPAENTRVLAEAAAAHIARVHEAARQQAAEEDTDSLPRRGFPDNPGPPVMVGAVPVDRIQIMQHTTAQAAEQLKQQAALSEQARDEARALEDEDFELEDVPEPLAVQQSQDAQGEAIDRELDERPARLAREAASSGGDSTAPATPESIALQTGNQITEVLDRADNEPGDDESLDDLTITDRQRESLVSGGYTTKQQVRDASDEELMALPGIGQATVRHLRGEIE